MFNKVLIANRGDQPLLSGEEAKPKCMLIADQAGYFTAEVHDV